MKTEKQIRDYILAEWAKAKTSDQIKTHLPLDIHLATFKECTEQGIDCPLALAEIDKVVQEPDDDFWIWCLGQAWQQVGEPPRVNRASAKLIELLAIKIGREALLEAHALGY